MLEIWKTIEDFPTYKISNLGNVFNSKRNNLLLQETTSNGYKRVTLYKDGKPYHKQVHRLVASAFIENPENYPFVNHKDEDPSNNHAENLEWCTPSYNINYGNRNAKLSTSSKQVKQMNFGGYVMATYCSANFAASMLKVDASNIYKCCRGEIKYAYGFKWSYV